MIVQKIIDFAKKSKANIGIGVGEHQEYIERTIRVAENAYNNEIAEIILVGRKKPKSTNLEFIQTDTPEQALLELINKGKIEGIVRGSLGASKFLVAIKNNFKVGVLYRLALLETAYNHQFFFAPVGIDECKNTEQKLFFVTEGFRLIEKLKINPKVAILSGGREEDKKRGENIARLIDEANEVVELAKKNGIENIKNYNILIEDAIKAGSNLIIGPEGMAGNLIYRTLVHLGKGKSHGAIYLGLSKPVIDTSRVGPEFEYYTAIAIASALKVLK
ncbi:MAG: phosphate acyltransferase [Candidatus Helarchaeota archaeon]